MTGTHSHTHYQTESQASTNIFDVRSKILSTFIVVFSCSLLVSFQQLVWFFVLFFLFLVLLKPRRSFLKYSIASLPIILSLSLVSFLSFNSTPTVYRTFLYSTIHSNVSFAVFSGIRSLLIVFFVLILIHSEDTFFDIIYGLDDLWMPDFLTNLTFLTYRFFFLMQEEFVRILEARSNRLYGQKFFFDISSLKILGNIIGSVLARSFKRAEFISATLSARGFTGKMSHPEQPWSAKGLLLIIITFFIVLSIMVFAQTFPYTFIGVLP